MSDTALKMSSQAAGEYLTTLRRLAQLERSEVAQAAKITEHQLRRLESGQSEPSFTTARRLMRVLGGSLDRFADILMSERITLADAMRDALEGRSIADLVSEIQTEEELEALIRAWRARTDG